MESQYLLLRNNRQSGPYTLDELVQQQLKANDLIWIEGKSTCWLNPSEMSELQPVYVKATPVVINKAKQSLPEKKEEKIEYNFPDNESQPATSISKQPVKEEEAWQHSRNVLIDEEEPIRFVFHKRKKNATAPQLLGILATIAFIYVGWHNGWFPTNNKNTGGEQTIIPLVSSESHTALKSPAPVTKKVVEQPVSDQPSPEQSVAYEPQNLSASVTTSSQSVATETVKPKHKTIQKKNKPVITAPAPVPIITTDLLPPKDDASLNKGLVPIPDPDADKKNVAEKTDQSSDKKRSLGQVIKGLFHKKKKSEDKPLAGTTSQVTEPQNK